jgi:hypothetical protein
MTVLDAVIIGGLSGAGGVWLLECARELYRRFRRRQEADRVGCPVTRCD